MKKLYLMLFCFMLATTLEAEPGTVSMTIHDAVDYALKNSRTLKSVEIELQTKRDTMNNAVSKVLPSVTAGGTLNRNNTYQYKSMADMMNPVIKALHPELGSTDLLQSCAKKESDYWTAAGTLSASLNLNLTLIKQIQQVYTDYDAGLITWDQSVKQTKRDITKLFYSLLLQQEMLRNDIQSLENAKIRADLSDKSFKNGIIPRISVLQASVTYKNLLIDVQKEELAFREQMNKFAVIIGLPAGTQIELIGTLQVPLTKIDSAKAVSLYSGSNSEICLLKKNIVSLDDALAALDLATFTPTLSLGWSFSPSVKAIDSSWVKDNNWIDTGAFSATLSWSLSDMFPCSANRIQYRKLGREKAQLELALEGKQEDIKLQAEKLFDDLKNAEDSITTGEENIRLAQESYDLTSESYFNGRAQYLDVRDAEVQFNKARLAQQSYYYTYISSLADLQYVYDLPDNWQEVMK